MLATALAPYPNWLHSGDNSWQLTAATLVGLMSVPGLVVLYGGVMQKRWSVNSMMLTFMAFGLVLVAWCLWAFDMGFGNPAHLFGSGTGLFQTFVGVPGSILSAHGEQGIAWIPSLSSIKFHFPESTLVYFQFVFAAITPILMLGSVLGRINFKAWIPFVLLWITCAYTVNAFLLWGGGFFAAHGSLDFSGGYVIHLAAGVSGFVAAAVIGPRLARDREVDAPNNLLMVATGAGLLWLGWNGFNGGDPYFAGSDASVAVINTNLCTAIAMLVWVFWDMVYKEKPGIIGTVNGMITGLVAITPAAGYVNGYGAICLGVIASTVVWMAIRYLSRIPPFSKVDDTLGVVYTHGIAGITGGLLVGLFADPNIWGAFQGNKPAGTAIGAYKGIVYGGNLELLKWQFLAAVAIIIWDGLVTFLLLKLIGLVLPLREPDDVLELGDPALHGHEVYPADVATLGSFGHATA
jgi:Amt family ammonium transporter